MRVAPAHLYPCHDGSHEVGDDKMVPEVDEPHLQLRSVLVYRTVHEHSRAWQGQGGGGMMSEMIFPSNSFSF